MLIQMKAKALMTAISLAVLAGCATSPAGMNAPAAGGAQVPAQWQITPMAPGAMGSVLSLDEAWWERFEDPALNDLIRRVLNSNLSLGVAALRVQQARLRTDLADSDRLPSVSASVGANASRLLDGGPTTRGASAKLSATWELDLWGRLSAQRDAAQWATQASEEDRRAVALSLVATTARLYWQLAYLDQRVTSAEQSLAYARQTQTLVGAQYKAGSVSGLEQAQAQQAVSSQEAGLAQLTQTRMEARQALALLLDGPAQSASLPEQPRWPQAAWPALAPGLPADLLSRRPDVRAAESRLRASYASVDVTRTSYYPSLSLTGSVGGTSESLSRVLRDPVGSLGATLVLPFLQFRDMQRNVAISQAEADASVLNFRQTLYQALSEVDQGLSAQTQYAAQTQALEQRLLQARKVERLIELRYRSGAEPLKSWLDAQESRRSAELSLADARYNQLSSWVSLLQALGGGAPVVADARGARAASGVSSGASAP
jgi:NodT family efflux transporter outer membrane factor (OMF) lipoprotein